MYYVLLLLLLHQQVGFSWSFTRETLLACELTELERLLAGRQEVLAMLHPLSSSKVTRMMSLGTPVSSTAAAAAAGAADYSPQRSGLPTAAAAPEGSPSGQPQTSPVFGSGTPQHQQQQPQQQDEWSPSLDSDEGFDSDDADSVCLLSGTTDAAGGSGGASSSRHRSRQDAACGSISSRLIKSPDVFAGLNLGLADSSVVSLEVGVVEVAHLAPRSGWSQDLTHSLLSSAAAGNARGADSSSASTVLMETAKREDLPLPVVYVFCGAGGPGDKGYEV